jgi:Flp pilus assembly pilin Flp
VGKIRKKSESGQAIVEYILLLAIVVGVVGLFLSKLTGTFDIATVAMGGKMEKQLRTGKAPASIWTR